MIKRNSTAMRLWRDRALRKKRATITPKTRVGMPWAKKKLVLKPKFVYVPAPQRITVLSKDMFKSVEKQAQDLEMKFTWVDQNKLLSGPYHYNSSIIDVNGATHLAYRRQDLERNSDIGLVQLTDDYVPIKVTNRLIKLPTHHPEDEQYEDPRFFWYNGSPWINYISWKKYSHGAAINICKLKEDLSVEQEVVTKWGGNWSLNIFQKNWVFFENEGKLNFIYHSRPHEVVELAPNGTSNLIAREEGVVWDYGLVRGGTSPILYEDRYYSFFHSRIMTPYGRFRYYMGAYAFKSTPPFNPVSVTKQPLLAASEEDLNIGTLPLVVFPCGAIKKQNEWVISLGVNDVSTAIVQVSHEKLLQLLKEST